MAKVQLNIDIISSIKRLSENNEQYRQLRDRANDEFFKREVGQRAIDTIVNRTLEGKDKKGKAMKGYAPYSAAYKKSDVYKIYGKTSTVNLKLTGEMHASIDVIKPTQKGILIGITDETNAVKADAHINGKGNLPQRDFWGLSNDELDTIVEELIKNDVQAIFEPPLLTQEQISPTEILLSQEELQ